MRSSGWHFQRLFVRKLRLPDQIPSWRRGRRTVTSSGCQSRLILPRSGFPERHSDGLLNRLVLSIDGAAKKAFCSFMYSRGSCFLDFCPVLLSSSAAGGAGHIGVEHLHPVSSLPCRSPTPCPPPPEFLFPWSLGRGLLAVGLSAAPSATRRWAPSCSPLSHVPSEAALRPGEVPPSAFQQAAPSFLTG